MSTIALVHQTLVATAAALDSKDPVAAEQALCVAQETCLKAAAAGVFPTAEDARPPPGAAAPLRSRGPGAAPGDRPLGAGRRRGPARGRGLRSEPLKPRSPHGSRRRHRTWSTPPDPLPWRVRPGAVRESRR
ncbi:MAG: hypothetical protein QM765_39360 [Myxococcales bacterium]